MMLWDKNFMAFPLFLGILDYKAIKNIHSDNLHNTAFLQVSTSPHETEVFMCY